MAFHIKTDEDFDKALEWLARVEQKSKSEIVREAVLNRYSAKKEGFALGALAHLRRPGDSSKSILKVLKQMDADPELDELD